MDSLGEFPNISFSNSGDFEEGEFEMKCTFESKVRVQATINGVIGINCYIVRPYPADVPKEYTLPSKEESGAKPCV